MSSLATLTIADTDGAMADELLSTQQVADLLRITRSRVTMLVRTGRIKATLVGKSFVFTPAAVEAFKKAPKRRGGRPKKK